MKLPEKSYYSLEEVAVRWNTDVPHLKNLIYDQNILRLGLQTKNLGQNLSARKINDTDFNDLIDIFKNMQIHYESLSNLVYGWLIKRRSDCLFELQSHL